MRTLHHLAGYAIAASVLIGAGVGCHFSIGGILLPYVDGGVDDFAATDFGDMPPVTTPDLAGLCTSGGPQKGCSSDSLSLLVCMGGSPVAQACDNGCSSVGDAHCATLDPTGVVTPADYSDATLRAIDVSGTTSFNSETGEIIGAPLTRAPGVGVDAVSGIGFKSITQPGGPDLGVFTFGSLTVEGGGRINIIGTHPIALIAQTDITINGKIDAQGSCMSGANIGGGGAGGAPKSGAGNVGGGMGGGGAGGSNASNGGGGGGGGYGETGGAGAGTATLAGSIGALFGDLTMDTALLIGGGGGGAGGGSGSAVGGHGGSGGGFVQLASGHQITLGANALLNAGGCHGFPTTMNGGGGGGGAGGAFLLESTTISLTSGATIVVNGAGGAGGDDGDPGADGQDDASIANGGGGKSAGTDGGDGGHTGLLAGSTAQMLGGGDHYGGGGGGGVGRLMFKTKSGAVTTTGVVLSPKIAENNPGHSPPATTGIAKYR